MGSELSEWVDSLHVGENGNEEDGFDVHFMLDPGDGLCTTLVEGQSEANAKFFVDACNSHFALLAALRAAWQAAHEAGSGREHGREGGFATCDAEICSESRKVFLEAGGAE